MAGKGGYGARTEEWGEGNGAEAHSGLDGLVGELGDALKTAGRRRRSPATGGEDGDGDGSMGRSGLRGLTRRTRTTARSSCACQRGEGEAVATATASGGDSAFGRSRVGERPGEGEE